MMLTRVTHVLPHTHIRRERVLPVNGRVIVLTGQKVNPADVIADTKLDGGHLILNISKGLGVSPTKAEKLVVRKMGDQVVEGDIIAGPVGSFISRSVRAPKSGRIAAVGGDQVLMELEGTPFELQAGFSGMVTELIADRGAVIENDGVLVQGVWGNERSESGILIGAATSANEELALSRLDISMRGGIVFGGYCCQAEIFRTAAEIPLKGLILASLTPDLIPLAKQAAFPILVLEGFGKLAMDSITFKILSSHEKAEVFVNATTWNTFKGIYPELIIPEVGINEITTISRDTDVFAPGQTIRVAQTLYKGKIGTIATLVPGLAGFPNGLRAPAALVHLENGEKVTLPLANLEIIE
jgi:hypothetical protein